MDNLDWVLRQEEGQFLERKSCYERTTQGARRRDVRAVAWDIAETLSAMANADGGALVLGLEDDGTLTGIGFPPDRLDVLRQAPQNLVRPPLNTRVRPVDHEGQRVLLFETD